MKKKRRDTINSTGINRIAGVNTNQAWIIYTCVKCHSTNFVPIDKLIEPKDAYENCKWECPHCGFVHAKDSQLPESLTNWNKNLRQPQSLTVQRFWNAFFTIATENPQAYWKQCNMCGRILPNSAFSKHVGWGLLEKQLECRACKGAINAVLNEKRTAEQLHEGGINRRIGDLLSSVARGDQKIDIEDLFRRFNSRCFKTGKVLDINNRDEWNIDHILPSKYFYPLTKENAALLSKEANSNKRDRWPSQYYSPKELIELSKITGADLNLLASPTPIPNRDIDVNLAIEKYLNVRNSTNLMKRIEEIKKVIVDNGLVDLVNEDNKKRLDL